MLSTRKHEIDEELGTPVRNHIKFPHVEEKKKAMILKKKKPTPELSSSVEKKVAEKNSTASNEHLSRTSADQKERLSSLANKSIKSKKVNASAQQEILKKAKMANVSEQSQRNSKKVGSLAAGKSSTAKKRHVSLGEMLYSLCTEDSETEQVQPVKEDKPLASEAPSNKFDNSLLKLDADSERRSVMPFLDK